MSRLIPASATVYTPSALARAMVRTMEDCNNGVWLDPCVGDGAFISEMAALGVPKTRLRALDLSAKISVSDGLARTERGVDFIEWAASHVETVDRIVMNPPYVALTRVRGAPRRQALLVPLLDGKFLGLRANYWCAFVLRAIGCLRQGGSMSVVLPAAWDFARYATSVRESVTQSFREVSIVRCATPLFPDVQEGAVVMVARGRGERPEILRRIEVADLSGTIEALSDVAANKVPKGAFVIRGLPGRPDREARLDELVDIQIGGVTGDAHYFLLTEARRVELGLPRAALRPVVSRSRHLKVGLLTRHEWRNLRDAGERVWLFRPGSGVLTQSAVRRYLRAGREGSCRIDGFKISGREPWHRTPLPERVDGFLSGMSKRVPFLVLREMPGLTATNTLYVVRFKHPGDLTSRAAVGLALLTSKVREELARHARVYADGLLKFEPADLSSVRMPVVSSRADALATFERATSLLLTGHEADAQELADTWVAGAAAGCAVATPREEAAAVG